MTHWVRARSPLVRTLVYVVGAALAFALAAGVGATVALTLRGAVVLPERQGPRPADEQQDGRLQQKEAAAERREAAADQTNVDSKQDRAAADRTADATQRVGAQRVEAEYVAAVEEIQAGAVETFRNSHEKLLRYDALSAADVEEMGDNETALRSMSAQAADLAPPQKYEEQHGAFVAAINGLREATGLVHAMSADPVAVTDTAFDEYDGRVGEASALLRRSNDLLGEQYETIGGVREVSPEF